MKIIELGLKNQKCKKCGTVVDLEQGDLHTSDFSSRKCGLLTSSYWECPMCQKKNYI